MSELAPWLACRLTVLVCLDKVSSLGATVEAIARSGVVALVRRCELLRKQGSRIHIDRPPNLDIAEGLTEVEVTGDGFAEGFGPTELAPGFSHFSLSESCTKQ